MNICIIAAALPPQLDGMGDYTALLAAHLADEAQVTVLTEKGHAHTPIPGVKIAPLFSVARTRTFQQIVPFIEAHPPDWVLLEYNPFWYGRWGFNPHLPQAIRIIKSRCLHTRIALVVHEVYTDVSSAKAALMATWQRHQLQHLGRSADLIFFAIAPWVSCYRSWFPDKPLLHLPVGSNIPVTPISRAEARGRLGIAAGTTVLGLFGTAHPSRMLTWVRDAARAVARTGRRPLVLYIGPHGHTVCQVLGGLPSIAEGPFAAEEVSRRFAAIDICLVPMADGVSTRRGSLKAALQHGVACVGTRGRATDRLLADRDGDAFLLADVTDQAAFNKAILRLLDDFPLRTRIGEEGRLLYEQEFAWSRIAARQMAALREFS